MWIITVSGWQFFKVGYTAQGIPYPITPIKGKSNLFYLYENIG